MIRFLTSLEIMVVNNFIQPYYGASYGMNPYAGYNSYGMSNPYGASPYGINGSYGGLPNAGYSPYGMNPYAQAGQNLANGLTAIFQVLRNLKDSGGLNKATSKAADDQWQKCGCSKN